jgi:hypothetical protein
MTSGFLVHFGGRDDRDRCGNGVSRRTVAIAAIALIGIAGLASAKGPKVRVTTAAELQNAVGSSACAGKTIELAPGVYHLDPAVGTTSGRLELQANMELEGGSGDSSAVIIDASLLPAASYLDGTLATGALRMGRGVNAVRRMTLRRAAGGAAFIETDLPPVAGVDSSVTVEDCIIEGNNRGIDFRLFGAANSGRTMTGTFRGNVLRSNTLGMGQGLRIACLKGANDATLRATVEGNTSTANFAGLLVASSESSRNTIAIDSRNNSYSGNGVGVVVLGAVATGTPVADDNLVTFDSQEDELEGNLLPTTVYTVACAGLAVTGADSTSTAAGKTSRNSVAVSLRNTRCADNPAGDVVAVGAHGATGLLAGTYNSVLVTLLGGTRDLDIATPVQSDPFDSTNSVTIVP